jgi:uncharacterized protein YbbC (DUF1343 family)
LNAKNIPGVYFRPAYWAPLFGEDKGDEYGGVELDVFKPRLFPAVLTAVDLITAVRDISPRTIVIHAKPLATDWGTDTLGNGLQSGLSAEQIESQWQTALERFLAIRDKYLLYD